MQRQEPPYIRGETAPPRAPRAQVEHELASTHAGTDLSRYFQGVLRSTGGDDAREYFTTPDGVTVQVRPVGNRGIKDVRIFVDTSVIPEALSGFPLGEFTFKFDNVIGQFPSPLQIVKIELLPFLFPRNYVPADAYYGATVYMQLRFVPVGDLYQTQSTDTQFTFELRVVAFDGEYVQFQPVDPTFTLSAPVDTTGTIVIRLFRYNPYWGGSLLIPIPQLIVPVTRVAPAANTQFQNMLPLALASPMSPTGAITTQFQFRRSPTSVGPLTALETFLINRVGIMQNCLVVGPSMFFDSGVDTAIYGGAGEPFDIFIPRHALLFTIIFSCLDKEPTNQLVPIFH